MAVIIGLKKDLILKICQTVSQKEIVEPVNFNALDQIVIAGHKSAVDYACLLAKNIGAKRIIYLPISVPSHSSLLKKAADMIKPILYQLPIISPVIPVLNNVDVKISDTPDKIRDSLLRQIWQPVRWFEIIQAIKKKGITHVVECGPGKVLTNLLKRIDSELIAFSINDPDSLESSLNYFKK